MGGGRILWSLEVTRQKARCSEKVTRTGHQRRDFGGTLDQGRLLGIWSKLFIIVYCALTCCRSRLGPCYQN